MSWLHNTFAPKTQAAPQQQQGNQGNQSGQPTQNNPTGANQGPNGQGQPPANNQNAGNQPPPDPLAFAAKMWDTPTEGDKAPAFALDPAQLKAVADSKDFTKAIPAELQQRIANNEPGAQMEAMQYMGRAMYQTVLEDSGRLTEGFVGAREKHSDKGFGKKVKGELVRDQFSGVEGTANPVVKKQLASWAEQLQQAHPDASPAEIKKMAIDLLKEMSSAVFPQSQSQGSGQGQPTDTNFEAWFDE